MSWSAVRVAPSRLRLVQRTIAVLAALSLALVCTLMASAPAGASSEAPTSGMTGMAGMAGMTGMGGTTGGTAEAQRRSGEPSASLCDGMCATGAQVCAVGALGVLTLLVGLLGGLRDTFLGMAARQATARRRRARDPWRHPAASLTQLCVLRV